ncbi:MAG: helix-turn-helix domain-containing protein [Alphaproteobacteria bacterium]|nr:helix-turn-helix domain-containing protein [Alphaproteobacteria bacterium]
MTSDDPNATAAESAVQQIGTEFCRLRSLRGERIEDIAAYLDIKSTYLFGVEQGDLSVISSKREAKAIIRNYADYLGLDGESIIGPMDPIIASLRGDKAPLEPEKSSWLDRTSAIILAASVVLGILVGWSWIGDVDQFDLLAPPVTANVVLPEDEEDQIAAALEAVETLDDGELVADIAEEELSGEAAEAAEALLAELKTALQESAVALESEPAGQGDEQQTKKQERPSNVLAALVAERGDGAHIYEAENTDARVIVRALTDVSVQVTSRGRDYVWTRTMKPREMLLLPNRDDLELWAVDAAGLEVLLDGVILPPLGPEGTVISGMSLALSSLEAISDALPEGGAKPTF